MKRGLVVLIAGWAAIGCVRKDNVDQVVRTAYYHPYGPAIPENDWKDQGSSGETSELLLSGVEVRREYASGLLHGTSSWTFPHSKVVERTEEYENGKLVASSVNYVTGSPKLREQFSPHDVKYVQAWYEDGSPRLIEEFRGSTLYQGAYYSIDGDSEGSVTAGTGVKISRADHGALLRKDRYADGSVVEQELYYPNGHMRELVSLKGVKREGPSKLFSDSGEPVSAEMWKDGMLDGKQLYFDHGQLARQVFYSKGVKHGTETHYSVQSGEIIREIAWDRDQRHGCSKHYLAGQTVAEWYWNGHQVTEAQFQTWNTAAIATTGAP